MFFVKIREEWLRIPAFCSGLCKSPRGEAKKVFPCYNEKSKKISVTRWLIDEVTGSVAERIYTMYIQEKLSYLKITEQLKAEGIPAPRGGRWVVSMVARILKDPDAFSTDLFVFLH